MTPAEVETLFTGPGGFQFARWAKPLAPVVFGTDDATLDAIKPAMVEVASLADLPITEVDPELGANLMIFFVRDWSELADTPDLAQLVPDITDLAARLAGQGSSQYRRLIPAGDGSLSLAINFVRMDRAQAATPARELALDLMVRNMLLWAPDAFGAVQPLATVAAQSTIVAPRVAALIRAAYDQRLPDSSDDPSLAYRLAARADMLLTDLKAP